MKRKHPKNYISVQEAEYGSESCDEDLLDVIIGNLVEENEEEEHIDLTQKNQHQDSAKQELFIDLTKKCEQSADDDADDCDVLINDEMVENIELSEEGPDTEEMTSKMYWENVLGTLEKARTTVELFDIAMQIKVTIKPLHKRVLDLKFNVDLDFIDTNALSLPPEDGPKDLIPVWNLGDGNCLGHSVSTGYIGNDSMHLEM